MNIFNTAKRVLLLLALIASYALIFVDESGIAVVLPSIQRSFSLTANGLHWVINSYLLVLAVLLLLGGKLSDHYGQRKVFLVGIVIFICSSIACALAQNAIWLILGRMAQGVGGSLLLPCISVLVKNHFPDEHFGKAYGFIIGFSNLFYALGPFIGGLVAQYLTWRWFFWLNLPVGFLCYLFSHFSMHRISKSDAGFSDFPGAVFFIAGISLLVFSLMQVSEWGWHNLWMAISFGFALLLAFIYIEGKVATPLLNLSLFKIKEFMIGNIILLTSSILLTLIVFLALWLQNECHFSAATVGLALLPATITFIFVPNLAGIWHDHSGAKMPILCGAALLFFAVCWFIVFSPSHEYKWLITGLLAFGLGIPLIIPNSIMLIMGSVSPQDNGMASGTFATVRQLGLTAGIALFASTGSFESGLILFACLAIANILLGVFCIRHSSSLRR